VLTSLILCQGSRETYFCEVMMLKRHPGTELYVRLHYAQFQWVSEKLPQCVTAWLYNDGNAQFHELLDTE
jgi:hypothetical protein